MLGTSTCHARASELKNVFVLFRVLEFQTPRQKEAVKGVGHCLLCVKKQTFCNVSALSALPPKADMCDATRDVRFGPIADMCGATRHVGFGPEAEISKFLFDHPVGPTEKTIGD
jgi:hypothetical protein